MKDFPVRKKIAPELMECLRFFIGRNINFLFRQTDALVLHHIMNCTLNCYGRDEFRITLLFQYNPDFSLLPLTAQLKEKTIYKAVNRLVTANVLYKIPGTYPYYYMVNTPALMLVLFKIFGRKQRDFENLKNKTKQIYEYYKAEGITLPKKIFLEEGRMETIKDAISDAQKKHREARRKKLERRKHRMKSPNDVFYVMEEICKELGLKFYKDPKNGKLLRSAKNWLHYCKENNQNPAELLEDVCKFWGFFCYLIQNRDGSYVPIQNIISFDTFFTFKNDILKLIELHREEWEEKLNRSYEDQFSSVTCINLNTEREARRESDGIPKKKNKTWFTESRRRG